MWALSESGWRRGRNRPYRNTRLARSGLSSSDRVVPNYDRQLYAAHHLIENFFAKIKQFRANVTRYEKTAYNFLAAVQLVASVVWLN
jgi:transposase